VPAEIVVDRVHLVAEAREPHGRRPPQVTVAAEDQDAHGMSSLGEGTAVILATHRADLR
jgi:hypothetical protein